MEQSDLRTRRPAAETRRLILETATRLFYMHGVRAVGMDALIKELGVGNMTVYRQFPTKDALVVAYVQEQAAAWRRRVEGVIVAVGPDPRLRLQAVIGLVADDIAGPIFRGCPMLNTIAEFPDQRHPAHEAAAAHKRAVRDLFEGLARQAGADDPPALAAELVVLMDGALAAGMALGPHGPASCLRTAAGALIDRRCGEHAV